MFDVITFGSSTWDVFIRDKDIFSKKNSKFFNNKSICFPLGSKIDIDEIHFFSGGGGSNTAASFLSLGFKTAYCGMVGDDPAGKQIINEMAFRGADTSFIVKSSKIPTNHSFILSIPGKDRTILTYRGASDYFSLKDIPFNRIKSKWIYIAPLSGTTKLSFEKIVNFAAENNIKVAVNLGNSQLQMPFSKIRDILRKVDVLILNKEEASLLTGIDYKKEKKIINSISSLFSGIFVMTKGSNGLSVYYDNILYSAKVISSKVVDRTGAGDSFGAGFVSGIIQGESIEHAIQLGSANATSCLKEWGAKNGLLKKDSYFRKIKVFKNEIS